MFVSEHECSRVAFPIDMVGRKKNSAVKAFSHFPLSFASKKLLPLNMHHRLRLINKLHITISGRCFNDVTQTTLSQQLKAIDESRKARPLVNKTNDFSTCELFIYSPCLTLRESICFLSSSFFRAQSMLAAPIFVEAKSKKRKVEKKVSSADGWWGTGEQRKRRTTRKN